MLDTYWEVFRKYWSTALLSSEISNNSSQETVMSGNFSKTHGKDGASAVDRSSTAGSLSTPNPGDVSLLESVSALMDSQADELELRRILKAMPATPDIEGKWRRYHVVRSAIQLETHARPNVNLLAGINARLVAESIIAPKKSKFAFSNPVLRYIGQGAIAASFFAITIIGTSVFNGRDQVIDADIADSTTLDSPVLGGEYKGSELSRTASVSIDSEVDDEALARLSEAVNEEFSGASSATEIPVSYTLEISPAN
jgi:hypothetical protein